MDPLSITASVIAIIQLTSSIIGYLSDVKDAPKECRQCNREALNLQSLLVNLRYHLDEDTANKRWYNAVRALADPDGPLEQYEQALKQLQSKIMTEDRPQRVRQMLCWRLNKAEVASILARMERLKSLVTIALEKDHL